MIVNLIFLSSWLALPSIVLEIVLGLYLSAVAVYFSSNVFSLASLALLQISSSLPSTIVFLSSQEQRAAIDCQLLLQVSSS